MGQPTFISISHKAEPVLAVGGGTDQAHSVISAIGRTCPHFYPRIAMFERNFVAGGWSIKDGSRRIGLLVANFLVYDRRSIVRSRHLRRENEKSYGAHSGDIRMQAEDCKTIVEIPPRIPTFEEG